MAFDFKKEYKEFYMPKNKPKIVNVPKANYIAVKGKDNPNEEGGAYQQAISVLYAVAYTLKMSHKTDYKIEGFFEYVVPPLEGFWWQENIDGCDYGDKSSFNWISVIRLPDFVTKENFDWAVETASKKKKLDCSSVEYLTIDEGLCVQIMHLGSFDDEPATVALMDKYLAENGYENDINKDRLHHEIYMSDARKVAPENGKLLFGIQLEKCKIKIYEVLRKLNFSDKNGLVIIWIFRQLQPVENLDPAQYWFENKTSLDKQILFNALLFDFADYLQTEFYKNNLTKEMIVRFESANENINFVQLTILNVKSSSYLEQIFQNSFDEYILNLNDLKIKEIKNH